MIGSCRARSVTSGYLKSPAFFPKKTKMLHQTCHITARPMSTDMTDLECRPRPTRTSQFMVVGLGNHSMPETRHSVGMATIDRLCRRLKARKYQVASRNVYLLHDDLDRTFGKFNIKEGGSAGGHNGVKSAICALGTDVMPRLKIGIGRPTNRNAVTDYVLSGFSIPEKECLSQILDECVQTLIDHMVKKAEKT
ncbi:probable peptidyl-tRNA hydrolase isoform X2 [Acanthaster planci]|uniref:Probable peptidyl-tRNA hydrolase isoform X2 n=1 Tax=Acanthaster planci TaxID=133434 RepID=A0A8B7YN84_ACAPL|nr:probable peptidyl-tRNA hydrolase isoform X2 [Acanthaster planci]